MQRLTVPIGIVVGVAVFLYSISFIDPSVYKKGLAKSACAYFVGATLVCTISQRPMRASLFFALPFVVWGGFWWAVSGFSQKNDGGLYAVAALLLAIMAAAVASRVRKSFARPW